MALLLEAARKGVVQVMYKIMYKVMYKGVSWYQAGLDAHQVIADLAFVNIHGVAIRKTSKGELS
jgi:hypothetical protein